MRPGPTCANRRLTDIFVVGDGAVGLNVRGGFISKAASVPCRDRRTHTAAKKIIASFRYVLKTPTRAVDLEALRRGVEDSEDLVAVFSADRDALAVFEFQDWG